MSEKMKELDYDDWCFACGQDNPIGLKLDFKKDGDNGVIAEFVPGKEYQGYLEIMHGGITSTLLDEAMAKCMMICFDRLSVTIRLEARFRKPVPIGRKVVVKALYEKQEKSFHFMTSEVRDEKGVLLASAKGVFAELENKHEH